MIELSSLHKAFGAVRAVADVSLRAEDGRITGILGPNGAGKTTTMRMVYGLLRPDRGSVRVDGLDPFATPEAARRRMGILSDSKGIYPRLTARENVEYFGRLCGLAGPGLGERVESLLLRLDLTAVADRRAEGFSQGERMKVAIARALVHDPGNVLLDEPTNGLDVMSTRAMRDLVRGLRDEGRCVVFSSHVMQEVSALCDSVIVIAAGRVVALGSPAELLDEAGTTSLEDAFVTLVARADAGPRGAADPHRGDAP